MKELERSSSYPYREKKKKKVGNYKLMAIHELIRKLRDQDRVILKSRDIEHEYLLK